MSRLDTQNFNKKAKIKKIFISSALLAIPIFASFAIACTPTTSKTKLTEEDKRFAETGKGTDVSVKILDNKKLLFNLNMQAMNTLHFLIIDDQRIQVKVLDRIHMK
ncbi:hypothetical protein [Mycoplasmopsis agassizii]|uniref:Lipoprotein n=1 Tax=Mycoplasmopsis agassizii TaxID=33922 RepID=A0ABX4H6G1_9BACT|nr:hypothetical protein [Mycoplasmopsis agassizii]PAF55474.1 hypothetical protein CJF60_02200 [Mycoplasmopsis agassizii]SMC18936.1 hypothetical protein SAMN02745179_00806 [Mycoplasmopsis agassizii]